MPITILPAPPLNHVGPGLPISAFSSFIGPLPTDSFFRVQVSDQPEPTDPSWEEDFATTLNQITAYIATKTSTRLRLPQRAVANGVQVNVTAELHSPTAVLDSGTAQLPWDTTSGLGQQLAITPAVPVNVQGGFTASDRAQQQAIADSTVPAIALDSTVPVERPLVPPGGVSSNTLPLPLFGLIIRITSVPSDIVSTTPDGDYFFPSLAVATIFRDADIWLRVPIHTPSKVIPLFGDNIQAAVANALALNWIAKMSYQVSFRDSVAGTVTEMHFP